MDGEIIYHYNIIDGELTVKKGIIKTANEGKKYSYKYVEFDYGRLEIPRMSEIGIIHSGRPSLWLFERDDELAKKMFIEYEEECIEKAKEDIEKRQKLLEVIKEGIKENGKQSNN